MHTTIRHSLLDLSVLRFDHELWLSLSLPHVVYWNADQSVRRKAVKVLRVGTDVFDATALGSRYTSMIWECNVCNVMFLVEL